MKTQSTAGGGGCLPHRSGPFLVSSLVSLLGPSCLLASYGLVVSLSHPLILSSSHPLILSSVRLIRSPRFVLLVSLIRTPSPIGSSARLIGSVHRLAPASYRPTPRIIDKGGGEIRGSSSAGGRLLACVAVGGGRGIIAGPLPLACLMTSAGVVGIAGGSSSGVACRHGLFAWALRAADVVIWCRRLPWPVCLPRWGWAAGAVVIVVGDGVRRLGHLFSISSAHPIDKASATAHRLIPSAHHLIDGDVPLVFFFFSFA